MTRDVDDTHRVSFYTSVGCDVFLFNYRGYGRSGGSASPNTINKDVREVVEYLKEQVGVTRLAVHGESIGGVAAASVARHSQVRWGGHETAFHDATPRGLLGTDLNLKCCRYRSPGYLPYIRT